MAARRPVLVDFDGERRPLLLPIGQVRALEIARGAGIAEIFRRVTDGRFYLDDLRESIRLGLEGGGMPPHEATERVMRVFDPAYLGVFVATVSALLASVFEGLPESWPGEPQAESAAPATTPRSTSPGP